MEERTADQVAEIHTNAGDSVTVIGIDRDADSETADEYKAKIKRNVDHLEVIKAYKKLDGSTSIWGSESFTAIDKAITDGKAKY